VGVIPDVYMYMCGYILGIWRCIVRTSNWGTSRVCGGVQYAPPTGVHLRYISGMWRCTVRTSNCGTSQVSFGVPYAPPTRVHLGYTVVYRTHFQLGYILGILRCTVRTSNWVHRTIGCIRWCTARTSNWGTSRVYYL
jgi:hypothetical protein